ncbi:hypothetical protein PIB30_070066 [Stylosanthes scabra]|uniref:Uncharacterized protein n=1 Tax=Stylosanthes scabra TaxID=79078 RepID=A0ABU6TN15_9FABA|nr:hypothetical protein [Stylosanthes scabra]
MSRKSGHGDLAWHGPKKEANERYSNCEHSSFSTHEDAVECMERGDVGVDAGAEEVPLMVEPVAVFGIGGIGRVEGGEMPAAAAAHNAARRWGELLLWKIRPQSELTRSVNNSLEPAPTLCHLGLPLQRYSISTRLPFAFVPSSPFQAQTTTWPTSIPVIIFLIRSLSFDWCNTATSSSSTRHPATAPATYQQRKAISMSSA